MWAQQVPQPCALGTYSRWVTCFRQAGKALGVVLLGFGVFFLDLGQLVAVKPPNKGFFGRLAGLHKAESEIADAQPSLHTTTKARPDASDSKK